MSNTNQKHKNYTGWFLSGILIIAAILRIILLCHTPEETFYHNDGREYMAISRQIAAGNGFSIDCYRWHEIEPEDFKPGDIHTDLARTPLFPLLGAGLFFLPWDVNLSARVLSILLSLLAVYCVYLLGNEVSDKAGLWSAFIFTFYPYALYYAASWSTENLFLITLALSLLFLIKGLKGNYKMLSWCGFFIVLASLTRPTAILLVPVFCGLLWLHFMVFDQKSWFLFRNWRLYRPLPKDLWKWTAVFLLVFFLGMLPWTVRNRIAGGSWNPTTYYDGYVFWLSNSRIFEDTYRTLDTPDYTPVTDRTWVEEHTKYKAQLREKGLTDFTAIGKQWKKWGLQELKNNPHRFPYLLKNRFIHYWRMCPNLIILTPLQIILLRIFFSSLFILAMTGLILKYNNFTVMVMLVPILFGMVISIPFLFVLRYRFPFFAPYICVLGGITLHETEKWLKNRKKAVK